jgi:hypothetical protein
MNGGDRSDLSNVVPATVTGAQPSWFELLIQQILGFFSMIIAFITGLLGLGLIKSTKRNQLNGLSTSFSCLANPKQEKCKIKV